VKPPEATSMRRWAPSATMTPRSSRTGPTATRDAFQCFHCTSVVSPGSIWLGSASGHQHPQSVHWPARSGWKVIDSNTVARLLRAPG
jgi:hypothetical protein